MAASYLSTTLYFDSVSWASTVSSKKRVIVCAVPLRNTLVIVGLRRQRLEVFAERSRLGLGVLQLSHVCCRRITYTGVSSSSMGSNVSSSKWRGSIEVKCRFCITYDS